MKENTWRYIAIAALSALGGLLTGQFLPNRNIVTADQLAPLTAAVNANVVQVQTLSSQVSELEGELRAQKMLSAK